MGDCLCDRGREPKARIAGDVRENDSGRVLAVSEASRASSGERLTQWATNNVGNDLCDRARAPVRITCAEIWPGILAIDTEMITAGRGFDAITTAVVIGYDSAKRRLYFSYAGSQRQNFPFASGTLHIRSRMPGDRICLYTDG